MSASVKQLLQYLLSGITVGSIYAIVAIGFNIIYNTTGIINFAQGEFVMLGAMIAISLAPFLPLPLAVVAAVVAHHWRWAALVELLFIRWLREPSVLRMIIITIGLSILLREAMLHVWDEKVRALPYFTGIEISSVRILGARLSPQVLWVLGTAAAVVLLLDLFFRYTLTGPGHARLRRQPHRGPPLRDQRPQHGHPLLLPERGASARWPAAPSRRSPRPSTTWAPRWPSRASPRPSWAAWATSGGAVAAGLLLGLLEAFSVSLLPWPTRT